VNRNNSATIPDAIAQLQRQLDQFRSTQQQRTKLPESLWQAAVDLARQHGVYAVAHPLRLDYTRLKKRVSGLPSSRRRVSKTAFVELIAPHPVTLGECVIEIESLRGAKMRIQWKAAAPPDWEKLFRAWRDASA
jgi:hypothetical protein